MSLWEELYSGIIIGLCMSFKSLLSQFPDKKVALAICSYAFYTLLGGLWSGWLKMAVGILTFFLSAQFDSVFKFLWDALFCGASSRGSTTFWGGRRRPRQTSWWRKLWEIITY